MIRPLILAAVLSTGFWWQWQPPQVVAPDPGPAKTVWHRHNVSGFILLLGDSLWVLPPGTQLLIPVTVTGQDTIPDWSKV